jgi:hypothetical protein
MRFVARAVIGAQDHYGRAELVTLALDGASPVLLDRRRIALIDEGLPVAPYHHEALEMELAAASELVERVRRSVDGCARTALEALLEAHPAGTLVLPASPFPELPGKLEDVLRSRTLTNAADGMLYRESLAEAAVALGLEVLRVPRKADPVALASEALGVGTDEVTAWITRLGREAGAPWRKDHKLAAAAALLGLGKRR